MLRADTVLLISGFGDGGGGVFAFDGERLEQLDEMSSTGLTRVNGHIARLLRNGDELDRPGELLLYDSHGLVRHLRVPALMDAHDVAYHDGSFVVASPLSNSLVWLSDEGTVERVWQAPGEGDAWHVNSLLVEKGRLYFAAFGEFSAHREWAVRGASGSGFVRELETDTVVMEGLSCPHHPRRVDGRWLVCNSQEHEVLVVDRESGLERRIQLSDWTRGVAVTKRAVFVGQSANRIHEEGRARVAVVSRDSWEVVDELELPCREIYDIVEVPRNLAAGLRQRPWLRVVPTAGERSEPMAGDDFSARVEASVPPAAKAGTILGIDCVFGNESREATFASSPPNPVQLAYRWFAESGEPLPDDAVRSRLPRPVPPGDRVAVKLPVATPNEPGTYRLRLTAVQEFVAWFDEVAVTSALEGEVRVA